MKNDLAGKSLGEIIAAAPLVEPPFLTIHRKTSEGVCNRRKLADTADDFVVTGWKVQHRALSKMSGEKSGESELGVIETWLSTHFVTGVREFVFCNERSRDG